MTPVSNTPKCRHGYVVNECPHPAITCNYSRDYELAKHVPPPAGAVLHPKQIEWAKKQGSEWARDL